MGRFRDDVIGWKDTHHGVRVDRLQNMRGQPDGGRGVALRRFSQDLVFQHLGELANDLGTQTIVGENPQAFRRNHRGPAVYRLLNERSLA